MRSITNSWFIRDALQVRSDVHRSMMTLVFSLLLVYAAPMPVDGQFDPKLLTPVETNKVDGLRLQLPEWNCYLDSPSRAYRWFALPRINANPLVEAYVCYDSLNNYGILLTLTKEHILWDKDSHKDITRAMQDTVAEYGGSITNVLFRLVDKPIAGNSYSLSYSIVLTNGGVYPVLAQGGSAGSTYQFASYRTDEPGREAFERCVSSFQLIKQTDPITSPMATTGGRSGTKHHLRYFVVVSLVLMVSGIVNFIAGRSILNGGGIAFVLIVCLLLWNLHAYQTHRDSYLESFRYNAAYEVTAAAIPLLISVIAWSRSLFKRGT